MRYLKNKLARIQIAKEKLSLENIHQEKAQEEVIPSQKHIHNLIDNIREPSKQKSPVMSYIKDGPSSTKNLVKNYSRAFTNFALSGIARPYLTKILVKERVHINEYHNFIHEHKDNLNCIKKLREILVIEKDCDSDLASMKRIFRYTCEVFLKYFIVNWLFSSKIGDKMVHLKNRYKMLRRVQNPEHFTYLEGFS